MLFMLDFLLRIGTVYLFLWVAARVYTRGISSIASAEMVTVARRLSRTRWISRFVPVLRSERFDIRNAEGVVQYHSNLHGHLGNLYALINRQPDTQSLLNLRDEIRNLHRSNTRIYRRIGLLENSGLWNLAAHLETLYMRIEYLESHDNVTYPNPPEGRPPRVRPSIPNVSDDIPHGGLSIGDNSQPWDTRPRHFRRRNDVYDDIEEYRDIATLIPDENTPPIALHIREHPRRAATPFDPPPVYIPANRNEDEELTTSSSSVHTPIEIHVQQETVIDNVLVPHPEPIIFTVPSEVDHGDQIAEGVAEQLQLPNQPVDPNIDDDLYA